MVGFYSYNPPKIYEALQAAGKLGEITVIAFDEDPITYFSYMMDQGPIELPQEVSVLLTSPAQYRPSVLEPL